MAYAYKLLCLLTIMSSVMTSQSVPERPTSVPHRRSIRRAPEESVDNSIVFPEPVGTRQFQLEIPDECKAKGYCENVPNFPQNLVKDAISKIIIKSSARASRSVPERPTSESRGRSIRSNVLYTNPPPPQSSNPEVNKLYKIQQTTRLENGSYKILNRLHINKRGGHRTNLLAILLMELQATIGALEDSVDDRVVFPGPVGTRRFQLEIPDECKAKGYCENVPNYPQNLVKDAINKVNAKEVFQMDELPDMLSIQHRFGGSDESEPISLCKVSPGKIIPQAAPDKNGQWYPVLNDPKNPLQVFVAEVCESANSTCLGLITPAPNYSTMCVQKHVYRNMYAMDNDGQPVLKSLRIPSCCVCVLNKKDL